VCKNGSKRAHRRTLCVREFLASKQITVLQHPPYSPDRAPIDFFLFPKIKEILKERHFDDTDSIRSNTTAALKAIPQNQFQNCWGGCTDISAWLPKGSTLKETTVIFSNEVCSTLTALNSRTLLSDHVCVCIIYFSDVVADKHIQVYNSD
jgi:hypothetical protein